MYISRNVLESVCRLSVAAWHDAPRERDVAKDPSPGEKKDGELRHLHQGSMDHSPDVPCSRTLVRVRSIRGTPVPYRQKDVLSDWICPTRTEYGTSLLSDYGMATGRELFYLILELTFLHCTLTFMLLAW